MFGVQIVHIHHALFQLCVREKKEKKRKKEAKKERKKKERKRKKEEFKEGNKERGAKQNLHSIFSTVSRINGTLAVYFHYNS